MIPLKILHRVRNGVVGNYALVDQHIIPICIAGMPITIPKPERDPEDEDEPEEDPPKPDPEP